MSNKKKLFKAIEYNEYDAVEKILIANPELVNATNKYKETPLQIALEGGYLNLAEFLVERGANFSTQYEYSYNFTPLLVALERNYLSLAKFFIENGADVNAQNTRSGTPLHVAVEIGDLNIVKILIENGADVNDKDIYGETPLHAAVESGHLDVMKFLIEKGADINAKNKDGNTPLYFAVEGNEISIIELIVNRIAKLEAADLRVDEQNLRLKSEYISSLQKRNNSYLEHFQECKEEVKKLEKENLIKFLKEGESVWVEDENVRNAFDDQERLKEQYPKYADMLIYKANEVKKEIFLHNNLPFIDVLSEHYGCDFNSMTFNGIEAFFRKHKDDSIVDIFPIVDLLPNLDRSLGGFINLDVKEKHPLSQELATWVEKYNKVSVPLTDVSAKNIKVSCCSIQ